MAEMHPSPRTNARPAAGAGTFVLLLARRRRRFFLDAGFEPTFLVFKVFLDFDSLCRRPRCGPGRSS